MYRFSAMNLTLPGEALEESEDADDQQDTLPEESLFDDEGALY